MVDSSLPSEPTVLEEPDVWTRRLAELVRLMVVMAPILLALLAYIKGYWCG